MSSTSSEVVLSSSVGKEKSVLWFNTYFFNFTPHTVSNMNDNVVCACPNIKPDYVEMEFDIQFIRVSELEFRVVCCQKNEIPIPGRQNSEFALLKSTYITRAASFLKEIVGYMKCRGSCMPVPPIDLGLILGFIFKGKKIQIKDTEILDLYYDAHRLGLNFLVDLIHDAILGRLENVKFFLNAMQCANRVNDKILFYELSKHYQDFQNGLAHPEGFVERLGNIKIDAYFMVRAFKRQMKRFASGDGVEANGSSNSSPKVIVSLK